MTCTAADPHFCIPISTEETIDEALLYVNCFDPVLQNEAYFTFYNSLPLPSVSSEDTYYLHDNGIEAWVENILN